MAYFIFSFPRFTRAEGRMLIYLNFSSLASIAAASLLKQPAQDSAAAAAETCLNAASRFVLRKLKSCKYLN